jgi:hypothetical protein
VTTPNQVLTNLLPERVYTWRVRANCSTFSSVATFNSGGGLGGNVACSAPSNLIATELTPNSVNLNWSAIEGAFYYTIQYRLTGATAWTNAGSVSGTSVDIGGLLSLTEYQWRVKASCSVYSSVSTFSLGVPVSTSCSAPSNTNTTGITTSAAVLNWETVLGALNYTVEYRLLSSASYTTAGTVTGSSISISGLQSGTDYVWRVTANCSPAGSDVQFTTLGTPPGGGTGGGGSTSCSSPSNTNTDVVTRNSAQVSWEPQGGALNYTVQYRLATNSTYVTVGTVTTPNATLSGLLAGREYLWRVKANCSPYGSDVQFSTPLTATGATLATVAAPLGNTSLVRLFPNPVTSDVVQIQTDGNAGQVFILNSAGQVVANEVLSDPIQTIDVSRLQNGLYFVRVQQNNGKSQAQKLVIAH